jgi:hypothetical protein
MLPKCIRFLSELNIHDSQQYQSFILTVIEGIHIYHIRNITDY